MGQLLDNLRACGGHHAYDGEGEVMVMPSRGEKATPRERQLAHANAVRSDLASAVQSLVRVLGKGLVAVIVNRDVKTVSRWAAGRGPSRDEDEQRVRDALQIVELLLTVDTPSTVRAFLMGMNPLLDDASPAEVLADGRVREVMAAARAYLIDE